MRRIVFILMMLALAGCAASAQTTPSRTAYIDLPALIKSHPMYPTLALYTRQITTLSQTLHPVTLSPSKGTPVTLSSSKGTLSPSKGDLPTRVAAQERTELAALGARLTARVNRAYAARAQYYRERESNDALTRARAVEGHRLALQLRLRDLALPHAQKQRVAAQLAALNGRLARAAAAERAGDNAALAAYAGTIRSQAQADDASTAADIARRANAVTAADARIAREASALPPQAANPVPAIDRARADVNARLSMLQQDDHNDRVALEAQLRSLIAARAQLYQGIVGSIDAAARRIAASRHERLLAKREARAQDLTSVVRQVLAAASSG